MRSQRGSIIGGCNARHLGNDYASLLAALARALFDRTAFPEGAQKKHEPYKMQRTSLSHHIAFAFRIHRLNFSEDFYLE